MNKIILIIYFFIKFTRHISIICDIIVTYNKRQKQYVSKLKGDNKMSISKFLKLVMVIFVISLFLGCNMCYAVDLNLTDESLDDLTIDNSDSTNTNAIGNNATNSTNNTNSNSNDNGTSNTTTNTSSTSNTSSATVTNALPESDLGLTNILNILLIVIGILLILLAIAILIRLKN